MKKYISMLVLTQYCNAKWCSCLQMLGVIWYIGIFVMFIFKELDSSAPPVLQAESLLCRCCCFSICQEAVCLSGTIWRLPEAAENSQLLNFYCLSRVSGHLAPCKIENFNWFNNGLHFFYYFLFFFFLTIEPKDVATHVLAPIFPFPFQSSPASEDVKYMASFRLQN